MHILQFAKVDFDISAACIKETRPAAIMEIEMLFS